MTRERLIERSRALSVFTGMPTFWAYTILRNEECQTGKFPTGDDAHYVQSFWAGNRAAFEEALADCFRLLEANPDDPVTISEVLKRIRGPRSHVATEQATSGEAPYERSKSNSDLPAAA